MLTVPEAARRAGRHPETIRRWIREGRLRAHKVGTQHVIEADDLVLVTGGSGHRTGEAQAAYASDEGAPATRLTVPDEWLPAIVGRVVRATDPVRIVLFGARARGEGRDDSDYELLVVLDDVADRMAARVAVRRSFADIPAPADVVVASTAEIAEGPSGLVHWALVEGRSVYERALVS
jgi:excisionase family DNA binding protein